MTDLKPIILKALKKSHSNGENMEQVANRIVEYIDVALDLSGEQVLDTTRPAPKSNVVIMPTTRVIDDEPEEILPPPKVMAGGKEVHYRTVEEIRKTLDSYAPPNLTVQPPGFEKPLSINRIINTPPNGLNFVKLMYTPDGQPDGPSVIFTTTEPELNIQKALVEIKQQATMMYSAERRVITPRSTPPINEADFMRIGVGADADEVRSFDPKVSQAFRTDRSTWDQYAKE